MHILQKLSGVFFQQTKSKIYVFQQTKSKIYVIYHLISWVRRNHWHELYFKITHKNTYKRCIAPGKGGCVVWGSKGGRWVGVRGNFLTVLVEVLKSKTKKQHKKQKNCGAVWRTFQLYIIIHIPEENIHHVIGSTPSTNFSTWKRKKRKGARWWKDRRGKRCGWRRRQTMEESNTEEARTLFSSQNVVNTHTHIWNRIPLLLLDPFIPEEAFKAKYCFTPFLSLLDFYTRGRF
jgi:hypothetical protein